MANFVVVNESNEDDWSSVIWDDIRPIAKVYLDNNMIMSTKLKNLKKMHFSNKVNRKFFLPLKGIWDWSYSIKEEDLPNEKNIIIFQSGIKFSPRYLKKLKKKHNAVIVLYFLDTVKALGVANNKSELDRYLSYYQVDLCFSMDPGDCAKYGIEFFDIYSTANKEPSQIRRVSEKARLFYVGNCRSDERLNTIHKIWNLLHDSVICDFNLIGVPEDRMLTGSGIKYNRPMNYREVVKKVIECDCILEFVNDGQTGNTLRFKEAVCYNKKLLTNNRSAMKSKYFNERYIRIYEESDLAAAHWRGMNGNAKYDYDGSYSPLRLLDLIASKC